MTNSNIAVWFLRVGIAFVFAYASVEIFINPQNFIKYTPQFVLDIVPLNLFLYSFAVAEVVLSVWLLAGWKPEYPSIISVVLIVGIVVCNPEYFQILFRNVAIAFAGLALLMLETRKKKLAAT